MTDEKESVPQRAAATYSRIAFTRADLLALGMSARSISRQVRQGQLQHVRRDRYVVAQVDGDIVEAVRIGGRLTCLSLFALMGVFVHRPRGLHVFVTRGALGCARRRGSASLFIGTSRRSRRSSSTSRR